MLFNDLFTLLLKNAWIFKFNIYSSKDFNIFGGKVMFGGYNIDNSVSEYLDLANEFIKWVQKMLKKTYTDVSEMLFIREKL